MVKSRPCTMKWASILVLSTPYDCSRNTVLNIICTCDLYYRSQHFTDLLQQLLPVIFGKVHWPKGNIYARFGLICGWWGGGIQFYDDLKPIHDFLVYLVLYLFRKNGFQLVTNSCVYVALWKSYTSFVKYDIYEPNFLKFNTDLGIYLDKLFTNIIILIISLFNPRTP